MKDLRYGNKLLFLLITFCIHPLFAKEENTIAGNIRAAHSPREFGKVPYEEGKNIPHSSGMASDNKLFLFSASYILWSIYQEGMEIATSNYGAASEGNTIFPYMPVRSGFIITAGKHLFYDGWEANLSYRWINNQNPLNNRFFNIDNIYRSPWINESYIDLAEVASSFSNQFNKIGGKLYKRAAISPTFTWTPWIGVQGAWEDQDLNADIKVQKSIVLIDLFYMRNKQYWWCIGPYAGTEISYQFIKHIALFGRYGGGINLCKHSVFLKQETADLTTPDDRSIVQDMPIFFWDVEPMMEIALGIDIKKKFERATCYLSVSWDLEVWFAHNGFIIPTMGPANRGNYSTQGLTVTAGVVF